MVEWQSHVKIGDLSEAYRTGAIDLPTLAETLSKRLRAIKQWQDDFEFQEIVDWFKDVAEDVRKGEADVSDYDSVLCDLYDWADEDHRLWIDSTG